MEQDKLLKLEDRCIQEHPAACVAACPIHVNARAMAAEAARGDFIAAAKIFKKTVPFGGIISRICDHPCQVVCKRNEADSAVSIRSIEKACLDLAQDSQDKLLIPPKKGKKTAIVGGGLSGLTAAFDLAKKGYPVVVFESSDRVGGSIWQFSREVLPQEVIAADLQVLEKLGVEIRPGGTIGEDLSLAVLRDQFDAVYLALGREFKDALGLGLDADGHIAVDAVTLGTDQDGVFAGGGMLRPAQEHSPIRSMADGRRAAISIDRYLQKVSLTASRDQEGAFETRLYTSTEGVEPQPAVPMADEQKGYSAEEAVREARRCLQCECLECVKVCEYLNSYGAYPKKYVRQIYNNLSIVMGHRSANQLINSCSLCGLCQEVCPHDLHMGLICKQAREIMVVQGKMPPSPHDFALRDMDFSNSDKCALARPQPGIETSRHLFFPGCQLSGSSPQQVKQVYALLRQKLSGGVGLMLGCCGAPADWSGRGDLFREVLEKNMAQLEQMGSPQLIAACSTCYEVFKTHMPGAAILSLWEVLDKLGVPEKPGTALPGVVAVHDACTTRHEQQIHQSVRNILARLGLRIEELPLSRDRTECCGYGGLIFFANPELARRVVQRRIELSSADYVAYCAMCRDYLASRGKRTLHLLDLILGSPVNAAAERKGPGYSQRHENRARLKNSMLKELWGETMAEKESYEIIKLVISEELRDTLEQRQILDEDIQKVIAHAERTGNKLMNRETGRFLAHWKPTSVTYWVAYTPASGGEYTIHNAYSHRMEIVEDVKS